MTEPAGRRSMGKREPPLTLPRRARQRFFGKRTIPTPRLLRRAILAGLAALLLPAVVIGVVAAFTPLPLVLLDRHTFDSSIRVLDRHGRVLAEVRADDGTRARWVPLTEAGPLIAQAVLAAEDGRFRRHPGVDPVAIGRAVLQNLWNRRIVSGASTLTQQLARTVKPRPRTLVGKVGEAALAVRIEASLSKDDILEQYLNLVSFGPSLRGVEAASRFYFDKPCSALSLAEAATLASLPKGPALYDPRKAPEAVQRRRDRILDRMAASGLASEESVQRAKSEPLTLHVRPTGFGAPHLMRALLQGKAQPGLEPLADRASVLHTTLDGSLQREVQSAARAQLSALSERHATAAAVVVLDNATGEVLAWLGAPDFLNEERLGQNDGVIALRQPGSTLKPFVYSVAIDDLQWTAATVLPDIELHINTESGDYTPHNYDARFHGPVRLREALANSYNVPAVYAASIVGPERVLGRMHEVGLRSLTEEAQHYGAAIALGDGEVRLIELADAYATLARGGVARPYGALQAAFDSKGAPIERTAPQDKRVLSTSTAALLTDILKDPHARVAAFGSGSVLELPFEVAVKTGTSKGFRDNLTVGYTREVTVAVWVGNFDGSPMQGVSGITGAGPLFRAVMLAAMKSRTPAPLELPDGAFDQVEICPLSGLRPGPSCTHRLIEHFARGTAPDASCEVHVKLPVDRRNGLKAGPGCRDVDVQERVFESHDARFAAWAHSALRPVVPPSFSPLCPGRETGSDRSPLAVRYPYQGASFHLDPSLPDGAQGIIARVVAPGSVRKVRFVLDGKVVGTRGVPFELKLQLAPGSHTLRAEADGMMPSEAVEFEVKE